MTQTNKKTKRSPWRARTLIIAFAVLGVCELLLLSDILADIFYIDIDTYWFDHNIVEFLVVVSLGAAMIVIAGDLRYLLREHSSNKDSLRAASGELLKVIEAKFGQWGLTNSEREIALLLIKGLSVQEITQVRDTRPGTVKSQSNAIYRKSGVGNRTELVAYFVEDLLAGQELLSPGEDISSDH